MAWAQAVDDVVQVVDAPYTFVNVLENDTGLGEQRRLVRVNPPQHGTAIKSGPGQVRYTPPAGFIGTDTFTYVALGSNRVGGQATVTVHVGTTLTIQGRVTDSPIADAQVAFSVAGQTYTTQADGEGYYSIEVPNFGNPDVVFASAIGGPDQPHVSFQSILGAIDRLGEEAGEDGVLERGENNQVQITNLSTAQSVLIQEANGGSLPETDGELAIAFEAINLNQVLTMAAAIKLVVDGGLELPEGVPDTLALINNPDVLSAFVNSVPPEQLSGTIASILQDPEVVPPVEPGSLPESMAFVFSGSVGTIRKGLITGELLELASDGTGAMLNQDGSADPGITWEQLPDGSVEIVYDVPRVTINFPYRNGVQVYTLVTTERFSIRQIGVLGGVDMIARSTESVWTFPDNPELPDEHYSGTSTQLAYRDGVGEFPYEAEEIVGRRGLPFPAAGLLFDPKDFGYAVQQFNADGTGSIPSLGRSFTWSLSDEGRLVIDYLGDGEITVRRIQVDGSRGEGVITSAILPGASRISQYEMAVVMDDDFVAQPGDYYGNWLTGFAISNPEIPASSLDGFYVNWREDNTGFTFSADAVGTIYTPPVPYAWSFVGSQLHGEGWFCEGCDPGMRRRWEIMAIDEGRIYVIEELDTQRDGVLQFTDQRSNFYEPRELPVLPSKRPAPALAPAILAPRQIRR